MGDLHSPNADVISLPKVSQLCTWKVAQCGSQSLVVDTKSQIRVLDELVDREKGIIGLPSISQVN